jgi:hypothetical protein
MPNVGPHASVLNKTKRRIGEEDGGGERERERDRQKEREVLGLGG